MNYPGSKGGVYQRLINLMPPHEVYIETHLGGGAVIRKKKPAKKNIGLNRNWCGKLTLFLPFSRCFTGSYFKIKKVPFFILNTIVKILIS